ncbi:arsenate reductase ArsC [Cryptosporangium japonicum]
MRAAGTDNVLQRIVDRFTDRYAGIFTRDLVDRYVHESFTLLRRQATAHLLLWALTERFTADRLAALSRSLGPAAAPIPEALFVCVRNAGRSQMAAALLDRAAGGRVHLRSAGSHPTGRIHPVVQQALAEVGITLATAYPKPLTDEILRAADVVVTMGCGDTCPALPGKRYLTWDIPDRADQPLDVVRRIRDDLDIRVHTLLDEFAPAHA